MCIILFAKRSILWLSKMNHGHFKLEKIHTLSGLEFHIFNTMNLINPMILFRLDTTWQQAWNHISKKKFDFFVFSINYKYLKALEWLSTTSWRKKKYFQDHYPKLNSGSVTWKDIWLEPLGVANLRQKNTIKYSLSVVPSRATGPKAHNFLFCVFFIFYKILWSHLP